MLIVAVESRSFTANINAVIALDIGSYTSHAVWFGVRLELHHIVAIGILGEEVGAIAGRLPSGMTKAEAVARMVRKTVVNFIFDGSVNGEVFVLLIGMLVEVMMVMMMMTMRWERERTTYLYRSGRNDVAV